MLMLVVECMVVWNFWKIAKHFINIWIDPRNDFERYTVQMCRIVSDIAYTYT